MYGVYRVRRNGSHSYIPRTATHSQKLAEEIAQDLTRGIEVLPTGQTREITPIPCIVKEIST